jgi:hypothetical protein
VAVVAAPRFLVTGGLGAGVEAARVISGAAMASLFHLVVPQSLGKTELVSRDLDVRLGDLLV